MTIEGEITIHRPVDVVFDYVADQTHEPEYNPRMVRAEKLGANHVGKGTTFCSAVRSAGRTVEMLIEITDYDRPTRLASSTTMKQADIEYVIRFEPDPAGTRMTWSGRVRARGALRLLGPLITWQGRRQERRIWRSMKARLEAGATPDQARDAGSARLPPRWFVVTFWHAHRIVLRLTRGRWGLWRPKPGGWGTLRLTTTGRRTGRPRQVVVGYIEDDDTLVTMAMNGWGEAEPAWWLNLQDHPDAVVETRDGTRPVHARRARGSERERLWSRWKEVDENLEAYAARRPRETAVVVLEPATRLRSPGRSAPT